MATFTRLVFRLNKWSTIYLNLFITWHGWLEVIWVLHDISNEITDKNVLFIYFHFSLRWRGRIPHVNGNICIVNKIIFLDSCIMKQAKSKCQGKQKRNGLMKQILCCINVSSSKGQGWIIVKNVSRFLLSIITIIIIIGRRLMNWSRILIYFEYIKSHFLIRERQFILAKDNCTIRMVTLTGCENQSTQCHF